MEYSKLVSVIILVYNTAEKYIKETLNSVINQTLNKEDYEIIIVNDCSTNEETKKFLSNLEAREKIEGISFKIINNKKNLWLAKTRIIGAQNASGKYLVFLDSDDLIDRDYLKKAALLLESSPRAGWTYPVVKFFGQFDEIITAKEFDAKKLFLDNYCGTASMYRREAWLQVLQREKFVIGNLRFYEDWDTLIRLMAKGWYGIPLNDSKFLYRKNIKSVITRSGKLNLATKYINWRYNLSSYFRIGKAKTNYKKYNKSGYGRLRSPFSVYSYFDYLSARFIENFIISEFPNKFFSSKLLFHSFFKPKKFIESLLKSDIIKTEAENLCGFMDKPNYSFTRNAPTSSITEKKILFAHPGWRLGGAENVLLEWMKSSKKIRGLKIIDLVTISQDKNSQDKNSQDKNSKLKEQFEEIADEQYSLDKISSLPLIKLKFCWNLIAKDRPDIIFFNGNPFIYSLAPHIKREFPNIRIIDILHTEELFNNSWFGVAEEYQKYIDERVVISDIWKKVLVEKYGEEPSKVSVCNNATDLSKFNPSKFKASEKRFSIGLDPKKTTIGFIGRLDNQKNPMVFVELAELMKEDRDYQFIMIGDGELYKEISENARGLNNLKLMGYSSNVPFYLSLCDVLVCPSKYEGSPLIGFEAAAMNVPIIATNIIGFREQVEEGKFGWLYNQVENTKDAKTIMTIIKENRNKFKNVGKRGRPFMKKNYDLEKMSKLYKNFIEANLNLSKNASDLSSGNSK